MIKLYFYILVKQVERWRRENYPLSIHIIPIMWQSFDTVYTLLTLTMGVWRIVVRKREEDEKGVWRILMISCRDRQHNGKCAHYSLPPNCWDIWRVDKRETKKIIPSLHPSQIRNNHYCKWELIYLSCEKCPVMCYRIGWDKNTARYMRSEKWRTIKVLMTFYWIIRL